METPHSFQEEFSQEQAADSKELISLHQNPGSDHRHSEAHRKNHGTLPETKQKAPEINNFRSFLVRREGFEPPAFWSVARRSIQLS